MRGIGINLSCFPYQKFSLEQLHFLQSYNQTTNDRIIFPTILGCSIYGNLIILEFCGYMQKNIEGGMKGCQLLQHFQKFNLLLALNSLSSVYFRA